MRVILPFSSLSILAKQACIMPDVLLPLTARRMSPHLKKKQDRDQNHFMIEVTHGGLGWSYCLPYLSILILSRFFPSSLKFSKLHTAYIRRYSSIGNCNMGPRPVVIFYYEFFETGLLCVIALADLELTL